MGSTGQREVIRVGQIGITFVLDPTVSGGSLSMFEVEVPSQARVPWPHSHDAYDETIYGRAGTMTWRIGDETVRVGAGDVLFIPRGVVHHFQNADADTAQALAVVTPGLLGPGYFRDIAAVIAAGAPPDPAAIAAVMRRNGLTPVLGA